LLEHERVHFDIAECNARVLRSQLRTLASYDECVYRIQIVRDSVNAVWNNVQERYDTETAHGMITNQQARWEKNIAHTLDSLAVYSELRFVVELKR
jgi:predicted secreted Zn-dependent protease